MLMSYPQFLIGTSVLAYLGPTVATALFVWTMIQQYCPHQILEHLKRRWFNFFNPYIQIHFSNQYAGEAFVAIEHYLSSKSLAQVPRLKAEVVYQSKSVVLSMDENEEVVDEFRGTKLWWFYGRSPVGNSPSGYQNNERRYYMLKCEKKHRELVVGDYLSHVMNEGKAIRVKSRQRRLYSHSGPQWTCIVFNHPATFETLAMEKEKKEDIVADLIAFSKAEAFYSRIGRAWKRGYLLYGPPGTGKSTMIAAMANFLGYDVFDVELTAVRNNSELRKLLITTTSKSIIVIEDIDCSLDLTGQRKKKNNNDKEEEKVNDNIIDLSREDSDSDKNISSMVTLSGLLNFIDGIWSASGGERLIVFTTNHVEKLDPALIRKGRMDKYIELSYCRLEAFKVLVKNYLGLDSHALFETVGELLEQVEMSPADVAEHLMPTNQTKNADYYLQKLISVLQESIIEKLNAKAKEEEEEKKENKEEDEKQEVECKC